MDRLPALDTNLVDQCLQERFALRRIAALDDVTDVGLERV